MHLSLVVVTSSADLACTAAFTVAPQCSQEHHASDAETIM